LEVIALPEGRKNISLEFANTAEWHAGPNPEERLTSYSSAVEWGRQQGIIGDAQATSLLARARANQRDEGDALQRVIALREAVYRIFSAVAHQRLPQSADLETLNAEFSEASAHLRLVVVSGAAAEGAVAGGAEGEPGADVEPGADAPRDRGGRAEFDWLWTDVDEHLTSILWPVARAATTLLTSPDLARVRECAGDPCGWLFLDVSKNGSRRWCDMADCGNRAKARRYRARRKGAADGVAAMTEAAATKVDETETADSS
jgi:predicted RNA-binding Zn ribbon-like protein